MCLVKMLLENLNGKKPIEGKRVHTSYNML